MRQAWKGALLSAVVFPGLGQLVLKHTLRGLAVMGLSLITMIVFVVKATAIAVRSLEVTTAAGGAVDMAAVNAAADQALASADGLVVRGALAGLFLCWGLSIVDAYVLGRKQDINN